jgi:hypothetical protein
VRIANPLKKKNFFRPELKFWQENQCLSGSTFFNCIFTISIIHLAEIDGFWYGVWQLPPDL